MLKVLVLAESQLGCHADSPFPLPSLRGQNFVYLDVVDVIVVSFGGKDSLKIVWVLSAIPTC